MTLKSLGQEGYQALLSHAIAMRGIFINAQERLNKVGLVLVSTEAASPDAYLRCIKTGQDPMIEHQKEFYDDDLVKRNSAHTNDFYEWYTNTYENGNPKISPSKSSAAFYNNNGTPISAFRFYFLNINNTEETMNYIIDYIINAKKTFDNK